MHSYYVTVFLAFLISTKSGFNLICISALHILKISLSCFVTIEFRPNITIIISQPWWSSGYHTPLRIRGSRVRSRPGSMDFFRA